MDSFFLGITSAIHLHLNKGLFFFYEVGAPGGIWGGGGSRKKNGLKGGPSKKHKGKGGSREIFL